MIKAALASPKFYLKQVEVPRSLYHCCRLYGLHGSLQRAHGTWRLGYRRYA